MRLSINAVAGYEDAREALMLLAVEPRLKGVLIASGPGTFKSMLARSFETLLPRTRNPRESRLIELPLNATEDRLLGGIDIELTLSKGRREAAAGLLAQADGRALYVDEINLLDPALVNHLAAALDTCLVRLEREGISESYSSDFVLVGTYDPAEGELLPVIQDRVGLIVRQQPETSPDRRAENVSRLIDFDRDVFDGDSDSIVKTIEDARERLPEVFTSRQAIRQLSRSALELGVRGNRVDLFAIRAARASAALAGRASVEEDDLVQAIKLVLLPRATRTPALDERVEDQIQKEKGVEKEEFSDSRSELSDEPGNDATGSGSGFRELVMKATDSRFPLDLSLTHLKQPARPAPGRRARSKNVTGGRYAASTQRRSSRARVAIDATLRAAAPHQAKRKGMNMQVGQRTSVAVEAGDLRFKVLKRRAGCLIIFAVDASGSMAVNRVAQAKGAMTRLLERAYLHRDRVAFISFRGGDAKVLLQPTRSVALGKRLIDALPSGGATPIAKGLLKAIEVARQARLQEKTGSLLLVFTDGRANVGLRTDHLTDRVEREAAIQEELKKIGAVLDQENVHPVVIDTRAKFLSGGEGRALARLLGARYLYLPRADADSISSEVARLATGLNDR
ncbi:MAG TPA: magnesium chelatase ATPase subunit D [Blastocatellia bacterium]|nr:magnesium chelatase ATPase subunit D [Blastocatellia bacterium]